MSRNRFLEGYRREPLAPPPPATKENWLAAGVNLVAAAFALLSFPATHLVGVFGALYGAGLVFGTFLVRPAERRGRIYGLLMLPLVLQAAVYILYWYPLASTALGGDGGTFESQTQRAAFQAATAALVLGWVPAVMLRSQARQGTVLTIVQIGGPVVAVVFYQLNRLSI